MTRLGLTGFWRKGGEHHHLPFEQEGRAPGHRYMDIKSIANLALDNCFTHSSFIATHIIFNVL